MKLLIGLGNPGVEYAETRHNIGFITIDRLAQDLKADWKIWGPAKNCDMAQISVGGEKFVLLKPLTYMNLSGQAAVAAAHFFKILPEDICAIHDDLDLPFGDVRLKIGGGSGGNNGLKSLSQCLATPEYARIRMGIGRPPHAAVDPADYVLGRFGTADWTMVDDMIQRAHRAVAAFAAGAEAFSREMNSLNRKKKD
ncbi:MAG: aminoacyl-tRNA hydrolase [Deltaproteobacteria bacterium]|nr:aminoacyl-tRNA hydrolase [Deltaproteobacteria bacterium]